MTISVIGAEHMNKILAEADTGRGRQMGRDKKNTMTRECIFTALLLLMEQKPYKEITITDIAARAGVSRMSYYRLYKSKDDILIQYADQVFSEFMEELKSVKEMDKYCFSLLIFRLGRREHQLLEGVFQAKLYEQVLSRLIQYGTYLAEYAFRMDMADPRTDYWIHEMAGKFCLVLHHWIERGMPETPEEMAEFMTEGPV